MTANADYGVSIVESFIPPKNMIPGQSVNKDVYAVNTGNIGAFVKETVSSKLTYTYEKRTLDAPDKAGVDASEYVELNENIINAINGQVVDGATSQEAGGYLAYTTAEGVELGPVNSARINDESESQGETPVDNPGKVEGKRWFPTKTGVYIFKRSEESVETAESTPDAPKYESKFKYAGYYYVADANDPENVEGKYYKIVIGNDTFRANNDKEVAEGTDTNYVFDVTVDESQLGTGVTADKTTGEINGVVPVQYVKNVTKTNVTPTLTYHKDGGAGTANVAYLTAEYIDGDNASADLTNKQNALKAAEDGLKDAQKALREAQSAAAISESDYEDALGAYNTAVSRYEQALADWTYADKLSTASTTLIDAAVVRGNAEVAKDNAEDLMKAALTALKDQVNNELETSYNGTSPASVAANTTKDTKFGELLDFGESYDISYKSIFETGEPSLKERIKDAVEDGTTGNSANLNLLVKAQEYMQGMENLWGDSTKGIVKASARLKTAVANFDKLNTENTWDDAAKAQEYLDELYAARQELEDLLTQYSELYSALQNADYSETNLTGLNGDENGIATKISNWLTELDNMEACITKGKEGATGVGTSAFVTSNKGTDILVQHYKAAYYAYDKQINEIIPAAAAKWDEAVTKYNKDVDQAKTDYKKDIQKDQRTYDINNETSKANPAKNAYEGLVKGQGADGNEWWLTDKNDTLVSIYSVERHTGTDANPQVTNDDAGTGKTLADLWQTIGVDATDEFTKADGSGYYGQKSGAVTLTGDKTAQAVYTKATNNNSYARAAEAVAVDKSTFKTMVGNSGTYETVTNLANLVKDDGTLKTSLDDKKRTYEADLKKIETQNGNISTYTDAVDDAKKDVANAAQSDASYIKFNIYLDDPETSLNWTPDLNDGESSETAGFYYNYVLEAGETSDKLIDAVELDKNVGTKDYKSLTFDLNVGLDSAQITYAADQKKITADAVSTWDKKVQENGITTETSADGSTKTKVAWENNENAASAEKIYKVGLKTVDEPRTLEEGDVVTEGTTEYPYELTYNGDKYYGTRKENGTTYYKGTTNEGVTTLDHTQTVTLTVTEKSSYTVDGEEVTPVTLTTPVNTQDGTGNPTGTYYYTITKDGKTYYGKSLTNGEVFASGTVATGNVLTLDTEGDAKTITLTVTP